MIVHPLDIVLLLEEPCRINLYNNVDVSCLIGAIGFVHLDGHCHALRCLCITVSYHTIVGMSRHGRPLACRVNILEKVG
jgi:hypothetical protein